MKMSFVDADEVRPDPVGISGSNIHQTDDLTMNYWAGKNSKDMSMNITSVEDKNIRSLALLITILVAAIHNIILAYFDWQSYITQRWFSLLIRLASPPLYWEEEESEEM